MPITTVHPNEISKLPEDSTSDKECQWIDVREPGEFSTENISGTKLLPLSELEKNLDGIDPKRPVILICRSGTRSRQAAERLEKQGFSNVQVMEGGILAWKAAGKPVQRGTRTVWAMDRQVRFAAGALVLIGIMGGLLFHPYFVLLSAFVGAGLVFSAVTDTCGMGYVLARMPWNRASVSNDMASSCNRSRSRRA